MSNNVQCHEDGHDEDEDERDNLLGGSACSADDEGSVDFVGEAATTRLRRVLSCRRMLQPGEIAGSFGDLGTFLPDVVALSNNPHGAYPYPAAFTFFSGVWSIYSGCAYDTPMPIQPMHAVTAVALTEGLTYEQIVASGLWLGLMFLVLGATGLVGALARAIPLPVVRGLQLGLGLKVMGTGITLFTRASHVVDTAHNLDGFVIGGIALLVVRTRGWKLRCSLATTKPKPSP